MSAIGHGGHPRSARSGSPPWRPDVLGRAAETQEQLTAAEGTDLQQARAALAERWAGRLADLLEEHPDAEADLRALVQQIQAALPPGWCRRPIMRSPPDGM
jgi:hypothetical protein